MKEDISRRCARCRNPFHPKRDVQEYCSKRCSMPARMIQIKTQRASFMALIRRPAKIDPGNVLPNF